MESKNDLARRIGSKVKELRIVSGLTQKRLAETTGLSPGLLSRIENGLTMPSIPTLQTISNNLNTEVGYFFKDEEEEGYIVTHPGVRRIVVSKSGPHDKIAYELELLAEGMKNPFMEPAIVTHVGKGKEVEARVHDGQEFMYVLEGRIKLTLGSRDFILKKGNAAYWNGTVPHKGIGLGKKPAKALHVHLIPGRWTGTFQYSDLPARRSKSWGRKNKGNLNERR
jgi:transcriptional regulator with XRE-family HTH domain